MISANWKLYAYFRSFICMPLVPCVGIVDQLSILTVKRRRSISLMFFTRDIAGCTEQNAPLLSEFF